ncbi:MAG: hypothetical protein JO192_03800 [Candidatus Eremiobacteraeota bacterium]|nr:hypothetical protein [Candidatus Eremiobacteraeota bacterium]MBV8331835.1 hypothetical protein [Candidatus Eremiobacteraeota bacterium]
MNSNTGANGYQNAFGNDPERDDRHDDGSGEVGKALLVGLLGGLVSAAGYLVYRRLPDEQRDRINQQVRSMVQNRISELRENLNI